MRQHVSVDAVVAGGGPSGIAVVGNLLAHLPQQHRQLWADPLFKAGRVNGRYREVPSNTKVELFSKFATAVEPFRHIVDNAVRPNAFTALGELPQDKGCELGHAADICLMLSDGIGQHFNHVQRHSGEITAACLDKATNLWTVFLDNKDTATTPRLVLCTGSSPISEPTHILREITSQAKQTIQNLHLDTALTPSILGKTIKANVPATVAVIGASHSAILVLMNLFNLAITTHPHLKIKWFTRHQNLRYAKYMDGWILYDNTGLKGEAAQWARENLEDSAFFSSPVSKVITKLWTPGELEEGVYGDELPTCTHIVQAIGYRRDALPNLSSVENPGAAPQSLSIEHDGLTGRFFDESSRGLPAQDRAHIPGLFGAGIAFPERVTDPAGNVEHAVGFWKFMNFCKRVVPQWAEFPNELPTNGGN
ncbi:Monooxygenase AgnR1 [Cladobotryum mycophilum]|uniref:Monooxygenase AgnR1 n=1 Tax=Cladobotryum mycophilum TaxID=491253 RepID=A0ABR0SHQ6_9HYPO